MTVACTCDLTAAMPRGLGRSVSRSTAAVGVDQRATTSYVAELEARIGEGGASGGSSAPAAKNAGSAAAAIAGGSARGAAAGANQRGGATVDLPVLEASVGDGVGAAPPGLRFRPRRQERGEQRLRAVGWQLAVLFYVCEARVGGGWIGLPRGRAVASTRRFFLRRSSGPPLTPNTFMALRTRSSIRPGTSGNWST